MEIECRKRNIPFESQRRLFIRYKEILLQKEFIADMLFFESIIVELKALERISGKEESQILNYLKATGCTVGVVINFGAKHSLEWKRYVY